MLAPRSLVATFALILGCGGGRGGPDDARPIDAAVLDGDVDAPPADVDAGVDADLAGYIPQPPVPIPPEPPPPDLSHLPVDDLGRPIFAAGTSYYLTEREPDALTALSRCAGMIVDCVDPSTPGHNLDACVISPPRCATAQPWIEAACCLDACVARYVELRTGRTPPVTAFRQAFYGTPSCAPGVDALLGGAP